MDTSQSVKLSTVKLERFHKRTFTGHLYRTLIPIGEIDLSELITYRNPANKPLGPRKHLFVSRKPNGRFILTNVSYSQSYRHFVYLKDNRATFIIFFSRW